MENSIKHSSIGEEYVSNLLADEDSIAHWGIKGQKWGRRRWQNEDGSLTPAGRKHYGVGEGNNDVEVTEFRDVTPESWNKKASSESESSGERPVANLKALPAPVKEDTTIGEIENDPKSLVTYRQIVEKKLNDDFGSKEAGSEVFDGELGGFAPGYGPDAKKTSDAKDTKETPDLVYEVDEKGKGKWKTSEQYESDRARTREEIHREAERKARKEEEAQRRREAKEQAEKEKRERKEAEEKRKFEEAKKKQEAETKRKEEEEKRKAEEAKKKQEAETKRKEEEEKKQELQSKREKTREEKNEEARDLNADIALDKAKKEWKNRFDPDEVRKQEYNKELDKQIKDLENSKNLANAGKTFTDSSKGLVDAIYNFKKTDRMDMSRLSDQQMREQIQRYQLESQYDQMFNKKRQQIEAGREKAQNILGFAGSALAITGSVLGIMVYIKQLQKK